MLIFWFLGVGLDHSWNIFALETVDGALWKGRCVMVWQVRSCCVQAVGYGKGTEDGNIGWKISQTKDNENNCFKNISE